VLVVTSSERMLSRILCHTSDPGPLVTLHLVLVEGSSGLQKGLVCPSSSGDDANLATGEGRDGLLSSRREANTGGSLLLIMGDNDSVVSRAPGELATVPGPALDVANNSSLRHRSEGKDVSNIQGSLLSTVNELSSVHALNGTNELVVLAKLVGIGELNLGNGGTSSGVVDDILDHSLGVAVLLSMIQHTKLDSSLSCSGVGTVHRTFSLPLTGCQFTHAISFLFWGGRGMVVLVKVNSCLVFAQ